MGKIIEVDDPRLVFVPIEEASKAPKGLCEHIVGGWWVCHPKKGLVFYKIYDRFPPRPQYNGNEEISKQVASLLCSTRGRKSSLSNLCLSRLM